MSGPSTATAAPPSRRGRLRPYLLGPLLALGLAWPWLLPSPLRRSGGPAASLRLLDRSGRELREVLAADRARARPLRLGEVPAHLQGAVLAAEDRRFRRHPGIDPAALLRAALADLRARRLVQGGSTISMQVARLCRGTARRGLATKLADAIGALRLEAHHGKDEILLEWLNRAPFGNSLVGAGAAAEAYFGVRPEALTPAQAASLAVIPRAPSRINPWRDPQAVVVRRDRVLAEMHRSGVIDRETLARALAEPLEPRPRKHAFRAPHFVEAVLAHEVAPGASGEVRTSLDLALTAHAERALATAVARLEERGVGNGAVVVLDVATREVLAWVGSADFFDASRSGQVDGVLARRQPGSTLKPFAYLSGLAARAITPASVLADLPASFATGRGAYAPENYDSSFRGPVRARVALACSLNLPAVRLVEALGVEPVLAVLRRAGIESLSEPAGHYGLGLALGDGEVSLLELVSAYATLADQGMRKPPRLRPAPGPEPSSERALEERAAWLIADMLGDDEARSATFGRGSVLATPFPALVKTGTTKNFRDNWCIGATPEVAVGVWVGNFDGAPMRKVTGVSGAGPVWRSVMLEAMRGRPWRGFERPAGIVERRVCPLSGLLPGPACLAAVSEKFVAGTEPGAACSWHVAARVEATSGHALGPGCPGGETRVFERYPDEYAAWARAAARPLLPGPAASCTAARLAAGLERLPAGLAPGPGGGAAVTALRIVSPDPSGIYAFDPGIPASLQRLGLEARAPEGVEEVAWFVDGERLERGSWTVRRGEHRFRAVARQGGREVADEVVVRVR